VEFTPSLLLNARFSHYEKFRTHLKETFLDSYYPPDAIRMELNSRDFASRVRAINSSTRPLCAFLRSRSLCLASENPSVLPNSERNLFVIKQVFYPEYITLSNYDMCRRPNSPDNFGPLFSLTFISKLASETFYNALPCAKGPSLGTNFTLVCPYTILAHYNEMEWAAGYGVEEGIVRVSVGMENIETLIEWFRHALGVAEAAVREA
jgi:cystathionine gamma-synthase